VTVLPVSDWFHPDVVSARSAGDRVDGSGGVGRKAASSRN
jgi:hypothetical protein